ncbi:hypothetical protein BDN70DRAFT_963317 [Pholiota conissans]|uniref:Uncharacterized protein n=1 Tax=Pholiota conissans TaxID=109636 RepID=A0A9P5YSM3_9AGAR|nr:hypothetical protein BDN70DRAFT_963317 [Pholiota conissans]
MAIHITDLIIELRMQILSRLDGLSLFRCAILYLEGLEKYDTSISSTDLLEYLRRRREKRDRPEIEYHSICIQGGAQGVGGFNSRLAGGKVDDVRRQILDLVTWNTSSSNAGRISKSTICFFTVVQP